MWIRHTLTSDTDLFWVITTPELEEHVLAVFKEEKGVTSSNRQELEVLDLDPGGVMSLASTPFEFELEGQKFSMKPEHLWKVAMLLSSGTFHDEAAGTCWVSMYLNRLAIPKTMHFQLLAKLSNDHEMQDKFLAQEKEISKAVVTLYSVTGPQNTNWNNEVGEA